MPDTTGRRTRLFIDYWNFQLSWNERSSVKCDWRALPLTVVGASSAVLASVGPSDPLDLEETLLYASTPRSTNIGRQTAAMAGYVRKPAPGVARHRARAAVAAAADPLPRMWDGRRRLSLLFDSVRGKTREGC